MIATDGFKDFAFACKVVKSVKDLPSSSTVARTTLDDVYRTVYGELQKQIQMMPDVVITLDFWTDKTKRTSYVTYTCHWMEEFVLKSVTLQTGAFPHPHKAEKIKVEFQKVLAEFKMANKTILVVSDGGTNIISLHNAIVHDLLENHALKDFRRIVSKIKKILMALVYKADELQNLFNADKNKQISDLLNNVVDLQEVLEAEKNIEFGTSRLRVNYIPC